MLDDSSLLRSYVRDRSEAAFTELVRRHLDFVYATGLRYAGSPARAQDVAQSVFTDLARKAPALAGRTEIVSWLHTSVHFAATALRRSEARRAAREQQAGLIEEAERASAPEVASAELRTVLDDALRDLGETERAAILLRYFKAASHAEIGVVQGISEDAARKRIDRAMIRLRRMFAKRGVVSSLAVIEAAIATEGAVVAPVTLIPLISNLAVTAAFTGTSLASALGGAASSAVFKIALVATMAAGVFLQHETTNARTTAQLLAETQFRFDRAQQRRQQVESRLHVAQQERADLDKKFAAKRQEVDRSLAASHVPGTVKKLVELILRLPDDDVFQRYEDVLQHSLNVRIKYPILEQMGFTPDRMAAFEALTALPKGGMLLTLQVIRESGGHGSVNFSFDSTVTVDEAVMRHFFGDELYYRYQELERLTSVRMEIVGLLATNLLYTDSPLDPSQAAQLLPVLAQASPSYRQGGPASPADIEWNSALAQANAFLSPVQLQTLARLSGELSTSWNEDSL